MAGEYAVIAFQPACQQEQGVVKCIIVTAVKIGSSHAETEKRVAGKNHTFFFDNIAYAALGMPRGVQNAEFNTGSGEAFAAVEDDVHFAGLHKRTAEVGKACFSACKCARIRFVNCNKCVFMRFQFRNAHCVIKMTVRQQNMGAVQVVLI